MKMQVVNIKQSLVLLCMPFIFAACVNAASDFEQYFDAGNSECRREAYQSAVGEYQEALKIGSSEALHHNLSYAYFKTNNVGRSLYHNMKARLISPTDPDIVANLRFIREAAGLPELPFSWLQWLTYRASINTWGILAMLCFWFAIILAIFPRLYRNLSIYLRLIATVCSALLIVSVVALYGWHQERDKAIILDAEAALRVSPTEQSEIERYLPGGEIVEAIEFHGDYTKVLTSEGSRAWVKSNAVGLYFDYRKKKTVGSRL